MPTNSPTSADPSARDALRPLHDVDAGLRARARREEIGLTRSAVARETGQNESNLTRWERRGIPTYLGRSEVRAWERALKVPAGWLFGVRPKELPAGKVRAGGKSFTEAGPRARERRDALRLTRRVVAARVGVTFQVLQKWEFAGVPTTIKDSQVVAWEDALRVEPGWLLGRVVALPHASRAVVSNATDARAAIREVAERIAAAHCEKFTQTEEIAAREKRYASIIAQRYGTDAEVGSTLMAIADHYGLTESRLSQILKKLNAEASALTVEAPVFTRIGERARAVLPCVIDELEAHVRPLLGGIGAEDAARFSFEVLGTPLFVFEKRKANGVMQKFAAPAEAPDAAAEVSGHENAIASAARGMIRAVGVAHVGLIKTYAIEERWAADGIEKIRRVLERLKGFAWLDDEESAAPQWFTLEGYEDDRNLILDATRRILSMCPSPVAVTEVMEAVGRLRAARSVHGIYSPLFDIHAPARVVLALLQRQNWLSTAGTDNSIRALTTIDPAMVLPQSDFVVCEALRKLGGVATRSQLYNATVVEGRLDPNSLAFALRSSPSVSRPYRGVYAITGIRPDPDVLARALREGAAPSSSTLPMEIDATSGQVIFHVPIKEGGQCHALVPRALHSHVTEGTLKVEVDGTEVKVRSDSAANLWIRSMGALLRKRGYKEGDILKLSIDLRSRSLRVDRVGEDLDAAAPGPGLPIATKRRQPPLVSTSRAKQERAVH